MRGEGVKGRGEGGGEDVWSVALTPSFFSFRIFFSATRSLLGSRARKTEPYVPSPISVSFSVRRYTLT